ncbi:MAG: hypothetical protein CSA95_05620 [Bacteroidetes bacterium]|nr:MAG: hypothetical protein CSA95_05620 [Bacteroidota bacterium]PIE88386.1 MAG: hypothetical protein CSA04_02175 [Bacteroidota bacterium]
MGSFYPKSAYLCPKSAMSSIKTFVFNAFQVNTYLLINEHNEAILIDGANYESSEDQHLLNYITDHGITLSRHLLTHAHIDHILGCRFVEEQWKIKPEMHRDSLFLWDGAEESGSLFGFRFNRPSPPEVFLEDGATLSLGAMEIRVLHTPGHADGSLCYYLPQEKVLFSGDVLFAGSVGRTDLPTGDMGLLLRSIKTKLLALPDDTVVLPGHGPSTTIALERQNNPFLS